MAELEQLDLPSAAHARRLTHYLFRYPAKFHPPAAAALLHRFTSPGEVVLDPFCGSGTLLVEAAVSGRSGIGVDIDPVAAEVSRVKTQVYEPERLMDDWTRLVSVVRSLERTKYEYETRMFQDSSEAQFVRAVDQENLWIPEIPNLDHWFRRYVSIDLSRLLACIEQQEIDDKSRSLFRLVFGSIIRNSSNADPVPVSGLEVTSHMLRKDAAGRLINPFKLFLAAGNKAVAAAAEYSSVASASQRVIHGDALLVSTSSLGSVDSVVTSPPYQNAVDYYRRHQLEMYWLKLVESHADRLQLLPKYLGRAKVPRSSPLLDLPWRPGPVTRILEREMSEVSLQRASDLRAYCGAMSSWFGALHAQLKGDAAVIVVIGQSLWRGGQIPTEKLIEEAALPGFKLRKTMFYPVKNRYMSYSRHNGADIKTELVLVLARSP